MANSSISTTSMLRLHLTAVCQERGGHATRDRTIRSESSAPEPPLYQCMQPQLSQWHQHHLTWGPRLRAPALCPRWTYLSGQPLALSGQLRVLQGIAYALETAMCPNTHDETTRKVCISSCHTAWCRPSYRDQRGTALCCTRPVPSNIQGLDRLTSPPQEQNDRS